MDKAKPMELDKYMDAAIDEQRLKLWEAGSIVESVSLALKAHFGGDWPAKIPNFKMALDMASRIIDEATGNLEGCCIEERGEQIAKAEAIEEAASLT